MNDTVVKFNVEIVVDPFADDDLYDNLFARLRCIADNILSEPVVDSVVIKRIEGIS